MWVRPRVLNGLFRTSPMTEWQGLCGLTRARRSDAAGTLGKHRLVIGSVISADLRLRLVLYGRPKMARSKPIAKHGGHQLACSERPGSSRWIGPGQMFSSLAKRFIIPAALCITTTGLTPSIASATHNGSWDETVGKRCWWKAPKPQDVLPPNATIAMLRDSPLSGSDLEAMAHDVEGKIDYERRSVGLQTIDRVDSNGAHRGWSSCISAAAAYHSADMILLNKLN